MGGFLNIFLLQFIEQRNTSAKEERHVKRIKTIRLRHYYGGMPA